MPNTRSLSNGTDELRSSAAKISNIATDFFKEYETIYSIYDNELKSSWIGSGDKEFRANTEAIKPKFKTLHDLLNEYSSQLINVADSYDSQEADIKSAVSNLTFE